MSQGQSVFGQCETSSELSDITETEPLTDYHFNVAIKHGESLSSDF